MPTPTLSIPVDDENFKRYMETFNKYHETLKSQLGLWVDIDEEVARLTSTAAALSAEIAHQHEETRRLNDEEKKADAAAKKAADEKKRREEEAKRREEEAAKRRKEAIKDIKDFAQTSLKVVGDIAKWATIGGGASLIGGALGLWGLDRFVAGIGTDFRTAQGVGVSMGERQSSLINLQRYFDVNQVLGSISEAQLDPSRLWAFRASGINPQGKDPAQLTQEATLAARRIFLEGHQNLLYAQARGLMQGGLGFSVEDLRRLAATPEGQLRQSITDTNRLAKDAGLADEVGRKWQNFMVTLDSAVLVLKNDFITGLTKSEGGLQSITKAFENLGKTVIDDIDWDEVKNGVNTFAKYINDGTFQKNFKTFVDDVAILAQKLVDALVWLHLIPDPGAAPSTDPNAPRDVGVEATKGGVKGAIHGTGGVSGGGIFGSAQGAAIGVASAWLKGLDRLQGRIDVAGTRLEKWGWNPEQTKGILANEVAESGLNPFAEGDWVDAQGHRAKPHSPGSHPTAYGLSQWHPTRQKEYADFFGHTMQSVKDPTQAFNEQLQFLNMELTQDLIAGHKNAYKKVGDELRRLKSAFASGYLVSEQYESPEDWYIPGTKTLAGASARGAAANLINIRVISQTGQSVAASVNAASR